MHRDAVAGRGIAEVAALGVVAGDGLVVATGGVVVGDDGRRGRGVGLRPGEVHLDDVGGRVREAGMAAVGLVLDGHLVVGAEGDALGIDDTVDVAQEVGDARPRVDRQDIRVGGVGTHWASMVDGSEVAVGCRLVGKAGQEGRITGDVDRIPEHRGPVRIRVPPEELALYGAAVGLAHRGIEGLGAVRLGLEDGALHRTDRTGGHDIGFHQHRVRGGRRGGEVDGRRGQVAGRRIVAGAQ